MRVRRLKWLRQIYEHQEVNRLLIVALEGHPAHFTEEVFERQGIPTQHATPWTHQFWEDLQEAAKQSEPLAQQLTAKG
eukprot:11622600-Heterocapsa_arctica.AAC.1